MSQIEPSAGMGPSFANTAAMTRPSARPSAPSPLSLRGREVVDVLRSHAEDHLFADRFLCLPAKRRAEESGVGDDLTILTADLAREEVHRRRSDEAGDEHVHRALVQRLGCVELLE